MRSAFGRVTASTSSVATLLLRKSTRFHEKNTRFTKNIRLQKQD